MSTLETATKKTYRSFYVFQSGQVISLLGSSIVEFVIIWWITIETESAVFLSIATFLALIPQIVITPFAGVLADRHSRKVIIFTADSSQAILTGVLLVIFLFSVPNIAVVLIIETLRSVFQAFHWPAYNAVIPTMVPHEKLNRVNGINQLFTSIIFLVGPVVAALLLELFPIREILLIDVFTFLIALIPLLATKIPKVVPDDETKASKDSKKRFYSEFKVGFVEARRVPGLFSLIILAMIFNILIRPIMTLMSYYIYVIHSGTALDLALVFTFLNVGNFISAFLMSLKKKWNKKVRVILICSMIVFISNFFVIFAPIGGFFIIGIGLFIQGFVFPPIITVYMTLLQTVVSKEKVGRITSIDHALSMASTPIGAIAAGPLAELIGSRLLYLICACLGLGAMATMYAFTDIRKLDFVVSDASDEINKTFDNPHEEIQEK